MLFSNLKQYPVIGYCSFACAALAALPLSLTLGRDKVAEGIGQSHEIASQVVAHSAGKRHLRQLLIAIGRPYVLTPIVSDQEPSQRALSFGPAWIHREHDTTWP